MSSTLLHDAAIFSSSRASPHCHRFQADMPRKLIYFPRMIILDICISDQANLVVCAVGMFSVLLLVESHRFLRCWHPLLKLTPLSLFQMFIFLLLWPPLCLFGLDACPVLPCASCQVLQTFSFPQSYLVLGLSSVVHVPNVRSTQADQTWMRAIE